MARTVQADILITGVFSGTGTGTGTGTSEHVALWK